MARARRRILSFLLPLAACVACLPAAPSRAAPAEEAATVPSPAVTRSAEPIPAADITARADVDEQRIQQAVQRARDSGELQRLEARLERQSLEIKQLAAQSVDRKVASLPVRRLESLQRHWQLYAREVADLRARISRA